MGINFNSAAHALPLPFRHRLYKENIKADYILENNISPPATATN